MLSVLLFQIAPHLQEQLADPLAAAEKLEARLKETPTDARAEEELVYLYSACALGVTTVNSNGLVLGASAEKARSATALECRKRLTEETRVGMAMRGFYQLAFMGSMVKRLGAATFDAQEVAEKLADKALSGPNAGDVMLAQRLATYRFRVSSASGIDARREETRKIVAMGKEAFEKMGGDTHRLLTATQLTKECVVIQDWDCASKYAKFALDSQAGRASGNWNYGNITHDANLALGEVALHNQDVKAAAGYLLASGKTSGSPQLNSFGPNMMLARDLLLAGDRKTVLEYFELCRKFWKMDSGKLTEWSATVAQGGMPNFGANILY